MQVNLDTTQNKLSCNVVLKELSYIDDNETEEESNERFVCFSQLEELKKMWKCKELLKNGGHYNGSKSKYDMPIDLNGIDYYPLI